MSFYELAINGTPNMLNAMVTKNRCVLEINHLNCYTTCQAFFLKENSYGLWVTNIHTVCCHNTFLKIGKVPEAGGCVPEP